MADLKVTKMAIKVDLQCSKCYRKIKKVLCRYPQIRDQVYDEKQNTVTITVVCCSPEKIKEKIACKAGDTVESIEIVPDKPKETEKKKEPKVVFIDPPKEPAKSPAPAPPPKTPSPAPPPKAPAQVPPPKAPASDPAPPPKAPAPAPPPKAPAPAPPPKAPAPAPPPKAPAPAPVPPTKVPDPSPILPVPVVPGFPPPGPVMYPLGVCCCCYEGGPCYHGRRPMCYDGCGRPAYECSGGNRGYYVSRCDEYFSEENASGCSVM